MQLVQLVPFIVQFAQGESQIVHIPSLSKN